MKSSPQHRTVLRTLAGGALGTLLFVSPAFAQLDLSTDAEADATVETPKAEETEVPGDEPEAATAEEQPQAEAPATDEDEEPTEPEVVLEEVDSPEVSEEESDTVPVDLPAQPETGGFESKSLWQGLYSDKNRFGFDGGFQSDVAYADYRFDTETFGSETFNDYRGQIWLTPRFEHRFGKSEDAYIEGRADFVVWLRDEPGIYQVNVFQAYAGAGLDDVGSLRVGRVHTMRIVKPGNGFDIFTIEDTGALREPNWQAGNFAAFRYELDEIWLAVADAPGRAVLDVQPLAKLVPEEYAGLNLQAAFEYGKIGVSNRTGYRLAGEYDHKWLRLAGGVEHRESKRSWEEFESPGVVCDDCYRTFGDGVGGNIIIRPPYAEGGLNYADWHTQNFGSNGAGEDAGISDTTTKGGYFELHTGHLIASTKNGPRPDWTARQDDEDIRQLRIGYGMKRTEWVRGNGDFEQHDQHAIYAKYNLGFNRSSIKLVGSAAEAQTFNQVSADGAEAEYTKRTSDMLAVRLRFAYYW